MKTLLWLALSIFCMIPGLSNAQSEDHTVITSRLASTPLEIAQMSVQFPEIADHVSAYEKSSGNPSVIESVQLTEARNESGGVDQSYFADGDCGTNYFGTIHLMLTGKQKYILEFSRFDSKPCGSGKFSRENSAR